ncbi:endonuclease exonuclease phosphatase family protein [Cyclospora cayetanensis]|uniref:Endonuclease exonuclease phosphatase family protein n=1 Tax=Cyclospora cayetanensis TaxID=88456 RepID=A0A1D3D4D0_9EIME|nr:endonuclease exonuclease phosphatase family protein [Cyclospora cayetanensis]
MLRSLECSTLVVAKTRPPVAIEIVTYMPRNHTAPRGLRSAGRVSPRPSGCCQGAPVRHPRRQHSNHVAALRYRGSSQEMPSSVFTLGLRQSLSTPPWNLPSATLPQGLSEEQQQWHSLRQHRCHAECVCDAPPRNAFAQGERNGGRLPGNSRRALWMWHSQQAQWLWQWQQGPAGKAAPAPETATGGAGAPRLPTGCQEEEAAAAAVSATRRSGYPMEAAKQRDELRQQELLHSWHQQQQQQDKQKMTRAAYRKPVESFIKGFGRQWLPVGGKNPCELSPTNPRLSPSPSYAEEVGLPPGTPPASGNWRIMSFNILAESLVDEKYVKQDAQLLAWSRRGFAVLNELLLHLPALICLQEVEECRSAAAAAVVCPLHGSRCCTCCFSAGMWLLQQLGPYGYRSVYKRLTSKTRSDGTAVFWREDVFRLVTHAACEFNFRDGSIMDKDQVALVVLLRELPRQQHGQEQHLQMRQEEDQRAVKPSQQQQQRHEVAAAGPRFLVAANTHLIFSPARGDVKLSQLLYFFRCLHDMRLRGILTAYEALTNTEGSFSVLRDGAASASASTVRRTYSKAVPHALGRLSAQGDPGTVGGTTHPWPHPKTLRCPGAEANSLRNALVAWASEKGERYRAEVEGLNERTLEAAERLVHVVACGDFNFTPQSPFYHLVTRGTMDFSRLSREKLSGGPFFFVLLKDLKLRFHICLLFPAYSCASLHWSYLPATRHFHASSCAPSPLTFGKVVPSSSAAEMRVRLFSGGDTFCTVSLVFDKKRLLACFTAFKAFGGQFLMSSKMYPIRSMGHCFAGASAMK